MNETNHQIEAFRVVCSIVHDVSCNWSLVGWHFGINHAKIVSKFVAYGGFSGSITTIDYNPIFIALFGSTKIKSTGKNYSNTLDSIPIVMQAIFLIERTDIRSPIVRHSSRSLTSFRLSKHGKYACAKRRSEPLSSATARRYIVDCYGPCTQKIRLFCIFLA